MGLFLNLAEYLTILHKFEGNVTNFKGIGAKLLLIPYVYTRNATICCKLEAFLRNFLCLLSKDAQNRGNSLNNRCICHKRCLFNSFAVLILRLVV